MRKLSTFSLLALVSLAACDRTTAPRDPAGIYALATVNDQALPFVLVTTPSVFSVHSGRLILNADLTYSAETCYSAVPCVVEDVGSGSWGFTGSTVTLVSSSGFHQTLQIVGGTLVEKDGGAVWAGLERRFVR